MPIKIKLNQTISINQSVNQSVSQSINQSLFFRINLVQEMDGEEKKRKWYYKQIEPYHSVSQSINYSIIHSINQSLFCRINLVQEMDAEEKNRKWYYDQIEMITRKIRSLPVNDTVSSKPVKGLGPIACPFLEVG